MILGKYHRKTLCNDGSSPLGRSFILGLPGQEGQFHVFLNGALWRIAAGTYRAGDRVQVVATQEDMLQVQRLSD